MLSIKDYRGHIRNWRQLCTELGIDGGLCREKREEQILLKAYEKWGYSAADHFHGMFAFALWDDEKQELFCVRDHFGTKTFYYYLTEDGQLLYGTMLRSITEDSRFKKELNADLLQIYMSLTYCGGEDTFFKGVKKLIMGAITELVEGPALPLKEESADEL